jgi:hypothetical protein
MVMVCQKRQNANDDSLTVPGYILFGRVRDLKGPKINLFKAKED